jgi:predicted RNase H-like nuclease (RuvC/YqgF family)
MSRLKEAEAKLAAALDRLEAALASPLAASQELPARDKRIAELERALERLNRDHMALEGTVDQVTARLDAAIKQLKTAV